MLFRLSIKAVAVVPILAPIIRPTELCRDIIPEFTKPSTITEVAAEDCIIAVIPVPRRTPFIGFAVRFSRTDLNLPPA